MIWMFWFANLASSLMAKYAVAQWTSLNGGLASHVAIQRGMISRRSTRASSSMS